MHLDNLVSRNYQRSVTGGVATELKYYDLGGQVLAMRTNGVQSYIMSDHLGSTTVTTDANGVQTSETRYTAFGEIRVTSGTVPTEYKYTGQLSVEAGLYSYVSRNYDPYLSHFSQADTLVPDAGSTKGFDRYSYSNSNPTSYIDPSGHFPWIPFAIISTGILAIGTSIAAQILTVAPTTRDDIPLPTSNDMTGWLADRINENSMAPVTQALKENFSSGNPVKIAGATEAWVSMVRFKGIWDFKGVVEGSGKVDPEKNITLCGEKVNFQAIANIHYGAIGRAVGIPQSTLELGAGAFQIKDQLRNPQYIGPITTYFDDPYDNWMINFGGWLYDEYGDQFGKLNTPQLEDAFKRYKEKHGSPGKPLGE